MKTLTFIFLILILSQFLVIKSQVYASYRIQMVPINRNFINPYNTWKTAKCSTLYHLHFLEKNFNIQIYQYLPLRTTASHYHSAGIWTQLPADIHPAKYQATGQYLDTFHPHGNPGLFLSPGLAQSNFGHGNHLRSKSACRGKHAHLRLPNCPFPSPPPNSQVLHSASVQPSFHDTCNNCCSSISHPPNVLTTLLPLKILINLLESKAASQKVLQLRGLTEYWVNCIKKMYSQCYYHIHTWNIIW